MHVALTPLDLLNRAHIELMYQVRKSPEVDCQLTGNPPQNYEQHQQYLENSSAKKQYYIIQADHQNCGYCQVTPTNRGVELGWALHPDWWGQGIGKKSVSLLVDQVKDQADSIILFVKKDNLKAITIYEKHGFCKVKEILQRDEYLMEFQT